MEKSFVTMEQKLCPVCGKTHDSGALLLDKRMRPKFDMHTTTGYDFCEDCQKKKDAGYIALIVCDPEKSTIGERSTMKMEDASRTGELIHIKRDAAKKMFNTEITTHDFVFIDIRLANQLKAMVGE